eukprot:scaffold674_cov126-Cylindrotheca_fusiformis.AAC.7
MKTFRSFFLLFLFVSGVNAFTTKKREQRNKFQSASIAEDEREQKAPGGAPGVPIFALPPTAVASTLAYEDAMEEDINISYGVALVSCALSLALGFGFGYGV